MSVAQSIFDVAPVVARAWSQRGYVPEQIAQARSYRAIRQRLGYDGGPPRLAAPSVAKIAPVYAPIYVWLNCLPPIRSADYLAAHGLIDDWRRRGEREPKPASKLIKQVVAEDFGATVVDMESARRTKDVVEPRQVAMWLMHQMTILSLAQIAARLGGRDHTTVVHAVKKIEARVASEPAFAARVESLKSKIEARS